MLRTLILLLCSLLTLTPSFSAELTSLPPHPPGQPIDVNVSFYVSNLGSLDQSSETFTVSGYLLATWQDPRLIFTPEPNETSRTLESGKYWTPSLELINITSLSDTRENASVAPDGTVSWYSRIGCTLSSDFNLKRFPFDSQNLKVIVESLAHSEEEVRLILDAKKSGVNADSYVSLSEWPTIHLESISGRSHFAPEDTHYSRITWSLITMRNSGFYVWKVLLPLLLISMLSWAVFWIDPKEFSTQVTIAVTNLLTIVAFLFLTNDSLPRVGYLTWLDIYTLICMSGVLAVTVLLVSNYRLICAGREDRAHIFQARLRWIMPVVFFSCLAALAVFGCWIK